MAKKKLTNDDANRLAMESGYFHGLYKILQDYEVSKELGAQLKAMLFKHILVKVHEARTEIAKLHSSVERLEGACQIGSFPEPATGNQAFSASVNRLFEEMRTFDGWTISLLESDISLLATVDNPLTAAERVKSLRESFAQLWALRQEGYKPFANHPEVFELTYVLP